LYTKTLQIGITGGIGSGKSTVCKVFYVLGIPIYEADLRARWLMETDQVLVVQIKNVFGDDVYDFNSKLNRAYLAQYVFGNPERIHLLNQLVHPRVAEDYTQWFKSHEHNYPYLIKEAALLYESGSYQQLDKIINVHAPEAIRIQRVRQRDPHRTEVDIRAIIAQQLTDEERLQKADYIIYNDDSQLVIPQILSLDAVFSAHH